MKALALTGAAALAMMPGQEHDTRFVEAVGDVPTLGIIGADAVREAFEGDLSDLRNLLEGALREELELRGDEDWWPYIHGLFDDAVIVERKDGRLMRYPYLIDGTDVTLGKPTEVIKKFVPADQGGAEKMAEAMDSLFLREADGEGGAWRIRVIRAGASGNLNYYPDAVLREAVPMFEGVRVFAKSDAEHLAGQGKDIRNLVGALKDVTFVEGKTFDSGEIHATLNLIEPDGAIGVKLREAWQRGLTGLFGFSIDSRARARVVQRDGQRFREAVAFTRIFSVDLIVEPGAGGAVIDLIEAQGDDIKETIMDRDEIIAMLEARGHNRATLEAKSDDELVSIMREALAVAPAPDPAGQNPAPLSAEDGEKMREAIRMVEARATAKSLIAASSLPDKAKERLTNRFNEEETFTEAQVTDAIKEEADYLASFTESGRVSDLGGTGSASITQDQFEKIEDRLDAFFDRENPNHRHARSFRECYVQMTGDTRVTGLVRNTDTAMREALNSGSFAEVLGNAITRRMIADYRTPTQYDIWRQLADVTQVNDFREQERTRWGGYGDLPLVNESGAYTALGSPTDESAKYAVQKRGGKEKVTLEMIKNDDVSVISKIPTKLSRAAKRTLGKFVLDFLRTNPTVYDAVALFHVSHNNLGADALSKTSLAARRLAMLQQTELDSGERLGIPPRYLWVPSDLEEEAVDLFRRNTEQDATFQQSLSLDVMPVWYWTDPNDWFLSADILDIVSIEIGFLDGEEEPEIFVQDSPTYGSMFSNDELTWKIRHIYGGAAVDYRGLQGSRPV